MTLPVEQFNTTTLSKHMLLTFIHTRIPESSKENFVKNLLIAGKGSCMLQRKVSVSQIIYAKELRIYQY